MSAVDSRSPNAALRLSGAADLMEGTAYKVLSQLGEGGMGQVFHAEHRALGHPVVIKILREDLPNQIEHVDRLRVEAQALARIRHPHLVLVTDFGRAANGRPYVVMERLVGRSLQQELAHRKVLPPVEAAEIARQILMGLSAAHEAGLVHRDIKPDNVFLCSTKDNRPFVKVLDFGVVKIAQIGRDSRTPDPLIAPTRDGFTLGTPRYFSPEQARGARDIDARSDVYSVGITLYEMLVGRTPFHHINDLQELFRAHVYEPPMPPSGASAQAIPSDLEQIVLRALSKRREDRYASAPVFAEALLSFIRAQGEAGKRFTISTPELVVHQMAISQPPTQQLNTSGNTSSGPGSGNTTATAMPVALDGSEFSGKLSDEAVVVDNLVDRILAARQAKLDEAARAMPFEPTEQVPAAEPEPTLPLEEDAVPPPSGSALPPTAPDLDLSKFVTVQPASHSTAQVRSGQSPDNVPATSPMFHMRSMVHSQIPAASDPTYPARANSKRYWVLWVVVGIAVLTGLFFAAFALFH